MCWHRHIDPFQFLVCQIQSGRFLKHFVAFLTHMKVKLISYKKRICLNQFNKKQNHVSIYILLSKYTSSSWGRLFWYFQVFALCLNLTKHCAHNCNKPYDEMHQGHWLKFKFGFLLTGKGSPKIFEIGWQTPEIHKINSFFT